MKQQTAVEWFSEKLNEFNGEDNPWFDIPLSILEQAKAMEKEQIEDAYDSGVRKGKFFIEPTNAEQYYNETYNK